MRSLETELQCMNEWMIVEENKADRNRKEKHYVTMEKEAEKWDSMHEGKRGIAIQYNIHY